MPLPPNLFNLNGQHSMPSQYFSKGAKPSIDDMIFIKWVVVMVTLPTSLMIICTIEGEGYKWDPAQR